MPSEEITYSDKYTDGQYMYRHVILPTPIACLVPKNHLMTETEWRNIGIRMSTGWVHYMTRPRESHVLLFRRKAGNEEINS
ncbi:cyclin-dependent [Nesidiocoris tenuis]|uniref:Cyclin-dependent kinases regulatory subunit n=1 Tax=Nesidiocoris tenuis TaxID=355587 RepID=A0ABN7B970_9HEMI|nr:cyclin-dependent [Nesidiocoris tenuis]